MVIFLNSLPSNFVIQRLSSQTWIELSSAIVSFFKSLANIGAAIIVILLLLVSLLLILGGICRLLIIVSRRKRQFDKSNKL